MHVTYASVPAPGRVNEDLVVAGNRFVVVLDGATATTDDTGCDHDVPWLVHRLGARLGHLLLIRPAMSLPDILAAAIEWLRDQHRGCDLSHPDSPATTVAILRERVDGQPGTTAGIGVMAGAGPGHAPTMSDSAGIADTADTADTADVGGVGGVGGRGDTVDYLVLADSPVLLDTQTGLRTIIDERLARLGSHTPEAVRRYRNVEGGFWVASVDPEAAWQAVSGSVPRWQVRRAALLTDGATRLVERFHTRTWAELLGRLATDGPGALIDEVRRAEAADAAAGTDRGGKPYDDATAALCTF